MDFLHFLVCYYGSEIKLTYNNYIYTKRNLTFNVETSCNDTGASPPPTAISVCEGGISFVKEVVSSGGLSGLYC